jgi:hypothetical protein
VRTSRLRQKSSNKTTTNVSCAFNNVYGQHFATEDIEVTDISVIIERTSQHKRPKISAASNTYISWSPRVGSLFVFSVWVLTAAEIYVDCSLLK